MSQQYIGRFAPSPSGPLHMGSLVTALGSYLQAKIHEGKWLLRIDDIDPPRIMPGAISDIQETLLSHGLQWDDEVIFQSHRYELYESTLAKLAENKLLYRCTCTRAQIKAAGNYYLGRCRNEPPQPGDFALRFINHNRLLYLIDNFLGKVEVDPQATSEDFIVKRKDGLYAYHLASVADDIDMNITEIVRGEDLLLPTACQWSLFSALGASIPQCMHLPLVVFADGRKLSKQNHAPRLDNKQVANNLVEALAHLGLPVPNSISDAHHSEILLWAQANWPATQYLPHR